MVIFAVIMGGFEVYLQGKPTLIFLYIASYLPVPICFFLGKKISYNSLTNIVLLDIYILSILVLGGVGLSGAGIPLLITFCVLTTTFRGIERGLYAILLSVVAIILMGLSMNLGLVPIDIVAMTNSTRLEAWGMAAVMYLLISGVMVACMGVLQNALMETITIIRKKTIELEDSNQQLKKAVENKEKTETELHASKFLLEKDIPILLCTGFSETITEERAISLGINGFLMKPVGMTDFSEKIRELLTPSLVLS
jgi:hypothetical protein